MHSHTALQLTICNLSSNTSAISQRFVYRRVLNDADLSLASAYNATSEFHCGKSLAVNPAKVDSWINKRIFLSRCTPAARTRTEYAEKNNGSAAYRANRADN
uniref:Uncharacterized protein n=1 Tax=Trichogramma kaykai TaxID=54128 RepID=A0ABD2X0X6_9HYME